MKKLEEEEKSWLLHHAKSSAKRKQIFKIKKRERNRTGQSYNGEISTKTTKKRQKSHRLTVPQRLDFRDNYEVTVQFLETIKKWVLDKNQLVMLDFRYCKGIDADACVALAATIDRCKILKSHLINGTYPLDNVLYFILKKLGFYSLLNVPAYDDRNLALTDQVDIVALESGDDNPDAVMRGMERLFDIDLDPTDSQSALDLGESGEAESPGVGHNNPPKEGDQKIILTSAVFRALTEAMGNAVEHAYPADLKEEKDCVPKWWRAGFYDKEHGKIIMVFYDQGAGIPKTMTRNWASFLAKLGEIFSRPLKDSEKIAGAMDLNKSSTNLEGRGKGLPDMRKILDITGNASLRLISGRGDYRLEVTPEGENIISQDHPIPLEGTLITWIIHNVRKSNNDS